jgi:S-adenosylmethionine synthetase
MSYLFTSEAVSAGHPDKICDQISDTLLDLFLAADPTAHTAIEAMATTGRIIIAGETLGNNRPQAEEIENAVRTLIKTIGYDQPGFSYKNVQITDLLHCQSADIAAGIKDCGAGDQGIMFGYAEKEHGFDSEYMPLAVWLANRLLENLRQASLPGLEPDAKSQITLEYNDRNEVVGIRSVVLSAQHRAGLSTGEIREKIMPVIRQSLPAELLTSRTEYLINPAGRFVIGGPDGDCGLTGRKIIADTYGGYAPHGGGAFSGKDPSKVDRSAAYMLRYLAKNIVAAGLADECLLQISYAIGRADPLSLFIDCRGTAKIDEQALLKKIPELVDLTPRGIIDRLQLCRPIYTPTAAYGHFGRKPGTNGEFSWEKTDLIKELTACF